MNATEEQDNKKEAEEQKREDSTDSLKASRDELRRSYQMIHAALIEIIEILERKL